MNHSMKEVETLGKQVNFYIEKELEEKFIQQVFNQGFIILAEDLESKKLVTFNELREVTPKTHILYLYKEEFGKIVTDEEFEYRLDYLRSPVIEFTRTLVKHEKKIITRGRLWVEPKYYDDSGIIVNKDLKVTKEFNSLVKWMKRHVELQDVIKGDYIVKEYITDNIKVVANNGFKLM